MKPIIKSASAPKFTLFTPTHNPKYLQRLEKSLANQTFQDCEWLIVVNGINTNVQEIKDLIKIKQARIIPYGGQTTNIGEIKLYSCQQAKGDILVEMDHDDELTPDCLAELFEAYLDDSVDFVYSNFIEVSPDGKPNMYGAQNGWKYRPFHWNGMMYQECLGFPPDPASFSKIWYGPNHVRTWRRSFYNKIGGHDPSLKILDDQDLFSRTYIHGKVKHLEKCLYVYYYHENNSHQGDLNAFIQTETLNIHDKYIYQLVEKWCDINGLRKIDLCGGINPAPGYESVDAYGGDITANLDERWPFEDGEVGVFRAHDALEHLKNPINTMSEAYRCLCPKGWFLTLTPSTDGRGAFQDPTHVSFWNSNSFWYYTKQETAKFIRNENLFCMSRVKNFYPSKFQKTHEIMYVKADMFKPDDRSPGWPGSSYH